MGPQIAPPAPARKRENPGVLPPPKEPAPPFNGSTLRRSLAGRLPLPFSYDYPVGGEPRRILLRPGQGVRVTRRVEAQRLGEGRGAPGAQRLGEGRHGARLHSQRRLSAPHEPAIRPTAHSRPGTDVLLTPHASSFVDASDVDCLPPGARVPTPTEAVRGSGACTAACRGGKHLCGRMCSSSSASSGRCRFHRTTDLSAAPADASPATLSASAGPLCSWAAASSIVFPGPRVFCLWLT
nr:uncharacterized protein LOC116821552 [Chelonoidis abingdonii]